MNTPAHRPVGVVGLSHLGVVTATTLAAKGIAVVAYDGRANVVSALSSGALDFSEPQVADALFENQKRVCFTDDPDQLRTCALTYIALDVSTDDQGKSDLAPITALVSKVAKYRAHDSVVVLLSQVPPGFTGACHQIPSDMLFYQVETLVFGNALARSLHPERFIIGCAEPDKQLPTAFSEVLRSFDCPVIPMSYASAELAKIAINVMLVSSLSAAAMLSEICEASGANWWEIMPALQEDRRIGAHAYLRPGLGLGGANLERDLVTVASLGERHGVDTSLVKAWSDQSRRRRQLLVAPLLQVLGDLGNNARVAVWGLAYKENTGSTRNSPSLATIDSLPSEIALVVHDPVVDAQTVLSRPLSVASTPLEAVAQADILAILTPWPEYRTISAVDILERMRGSTVWDPFGVIEGWPSSGSSYRCFRLGRGPIASQGSDA